MRLAPSRQARASTPMLADLAAGWRYVRDAAPIRSALVLLAAVSLFGTPYLTLLPAVAAGVFRGDARVLGLLMAAGGLGALVAALYLAARKSIIGLERLVPAMAALFGLSLAAFSQCRIFPLSLVLIAIAGAATMAQLAATNTLLQTVVEPDKRGRVMSIHAMASFGMIPLGGLLAGSAASRIGVASTLLCGALLCCVGALILWKSITGLRSFAPARKA
jgi:predicted MFS family arabinose efflux permease